MQPEPASAQKPSQETPQNNDESAKISEKPVEKQEPKPDTSQQQKE